MGIDQNGRDVLMLCVSRIMKVIKQDPVFEPDFLIVYKELFQILPLRQSVFVDKPEPLMTEDDEAKDDLDVPAGVSAQEVYSLQEQTSIYRSRPIKADFTSISWLDPMLDSQVSPTPACTGREK